MTGYTTLKQKALPIVQKGFTFLCEKSDLSTCSKHHKCTMKEINRKMTLRHIRAIRDVLNLDTSPFTPTKSESLLTVDDPTEGSDFFFEITDLDTTTNNQYTFFEIRYAPSSESDSGVDERRITSSEFSAYYNRWVTRVLEYNKLINDHTEESIVEGYEEEYFAQFDIVDDDADTRGYSQQAQNNIDDFLAKVAERLIRYKSEQNLSDDVLAEIDLLLADIERLRATQARQTKRSVFRQVIRVMAKVRKSAPTLAREISFELIKSLFTDGIVDSITGGIKGFLES